MFHIASTHAKMLPEAYGLLGVLAMDTDTEKRCQSARSRVPMSPIETGSLEILEILMIWIHGYSRSCHNWSKWRHTVAGKAPWIRTFFQVLWVHGYHGHSQKSVGYRGVLFLRLVKSPKKRWKDPPFYSWVNQSTISKWAIFNRYVSLLEGTCCLLLILRWPNFPASCEQPLPI